MFSEDRSIPTLEQFIAEANGREFRGRGLAIGVGGKKPFPLSLSSKVTEGSPLSTYFSG